MLNHHQRRLLDKIRSDGPVLVEMRHRWPYPTFEGSGEVMTADEWHTFTSLYSTPTVVVGQMPGHHYVEVIERRDSLLYRYERYPDGDISPKIVFCSTEYYKLPDGGVIPWDGDDGIVYENVVDEYYPVTARVWTSDYLQQEEVEVSEEHVLTRYRVKEEAV